MEAKMKGSNELPLGPTVFSPNIPQSYNFCKYAPLPDTCNSGPLILFDHPQTDKPVFEPRVVLRKRCNPPPWRAALPCSTPCCSAHVSTASLGRPHPLLSRQQRRRCHTGNLLQCLPTSDQNLQLYLAINTEEESVVSLYDVPSSFETQAKLIDRQMSFKKDYQVCDLQCIASQDETFMLSRGAHQVDVHRLRNDSLEFCNAECKSDELLTGACLSHSYCGVWLETNECQKVSLKNCDRAELSVWSQHLPEYEVSGGEPEWCSASFGYDDSTAVATNRTRMYLCDFRKEKPSCLFDIHQCKEGENLEEICNMVRARESPYVLLVMSHEIWLVDERHCNRPVITWNHLLLDQPRRSVLQSLPGLDVLMLSNNLEQRVAFAAVQGLNIVNETVDNYVSSPSLIFHHDFLTPMKTFAHKKGLWFDHRVSERLTGFENSGLATAKSPDSGSFTVFVSNNAGDIFSQKFCLANSNVESESTSSSTSATVERMKAYELVAKKLFCEEPREERTLDVVRQMQTRLHVGSEPPELPLLWDVSSTVHKLRQSSSHSKALGGDRVFQWTDHLVEDYKGDPNFMSNDNEAVDVISKYFHSKTVEITRSEWINSRSDELARKILNYWPLDEPNVNELPVNYDEADTDTWYRSVPYGKKFGRSDYVKKCRPRSSNGSGTGRTSEGTSSAASYGSTSLSGYCTSRATQSSSFSGGSRSVPDGGRCSTSLSQELLDASAAVAVLTALPLTPLPSTASQLLTPSLFRPAPSSVASSIKKKRKRNAGF